MKENPFYHLLVYRVYQIATARNSTGFVCFWGVFLLKKKKPIKTPFSEILVSWRKGTVRTECISSLCLEESPSFQRCIGLMTLLIFVTRYVRYSLYLIICKSSTKIVSLHPGIPRILGNVPIVMFHTHTWIGIYTAFSIFVFWCKKRRHSKLIRTNLSLDNFSPKRTEDILKCMEGEIVKVKKEYTVYTSTKTE